MYWKTISYIVLYALLLDIGLGENGENKSICRNTSTNVCCVGYYWVKDKNTCEECMPGYTGLNCAGRCPYPTYGNRCQGYCDCSNETCDVSTGCRPLTTDINENDPFLSTLSFEIAGIENNTITMNMTKSTEIPISAQFPTTNDLLRILILIFGLLDFSLICTYAALSMSDRCRLNDNVETENTRYLNENNATYENIVIVFSN